MMAIYVVTSYFT